MGNRSENHKTKHLKPEKQIVWGIPVDENQDIFDEVLGQDPEKKAAVERQKELQAQKKHPKTQKSPQEEASVLVTKTSDETTQSDSLETSPENADSEQKSVEPTGAIGQESAADSSEIPKKKRAYKKREPIAKPVEPLVESHEQRSAIKKMLLEKAQQAIATLNPLKKDSKPKQESQSKAQEEQDIDLFLESEVVDDTESQELFKETGIEEEGIHKQELNVAQSVTRPRAQTTITGDVPLQFLEDQKKGIAFIGRKKSVFGKYGDQASLYIGKVVEPGVAMHEKKIFLDALNPHVVFVCGARGSGKSYVLGVIAEELALKNKNVGVVVVDPVGVFWSMRLPNRDEKEAAALGQFDLLPHGLNNLKVFVPKGISSQVPKSTFDATFSMQPSLLTVEDWCLTFGMDRFSPTGLLLEKALQKIRVGYSNLDSKSVPGKKERFSLDDLITCLETDGELNSREKGYKQDSIRALVSRFEAAKVWGIFDERGTPLSALSKEGQLTVLDTSFLEDNVTALVIGLLARRILAARKVSTRKEAAQRLKTQSMDEVLELEIPPTWLFIDEAHTLIPSGNVKTPATTALVEYVKQGRRPGCSLVFATQQPAAIDSRVLSQLDVLISHKLVFDDDIKAVYKRIPTVVPAKFKVASFIKTLPVGVGLTADRREETSRAFVLKIRPRMSQHEGRDTETVSQTQVLGPEQVEKLAVEMIAGKLDVEGEMDREALEHLLEALNQKYQSKARLEHILDALQAKGIVVEAQGIFLPGVKPVVEPEDVSHEHETDFGLEEAGSTISIADMKKTKAKIQPLSEPGSVESLELVSFPVRLTLKQAEQVANAHRKKKALGLFGSEELVRSVRLFYEPVYRIRLDVSVKNGFVSRTVFVSSLSGEFVHFVGNRFVESRGVSRLRDVSENATIVLRALGNQKKTAGAIGKQINQSEEKIENSLHELEKNQLVSSVQTRGGKLFFVSAAVDIPRDVFHPLLESLDKVAFEKTEAIAVAQKNVESKSAVQTVERLFSNVKVKKIEEVYRPFFVAEIEQANNVRTIRIDAFNGMVF